MNDLDDIFGPSAGGGMSVTSMPTSVLPKVDIFICIYIYIYIYIEM